MNISKERPFIFLIITMKKFIIPFFLLTMVLLGCTENQNLVITKSPEQMPVVSSETEYNLPEYNLQDEAAQFTTEISGYFHTRPVNIMGGDYNVISLLITNFKDEGFKEAIEQWWNSYDNELIEGLYPFDLGCLKDGHIESDTEIDTPTREAILKSTKEKPVTVLLIFDKHGATDRPCGSFAQKIKLK